MIIYGTLIANPSAPEILGKSVTRKELLNIKTKQIILTNSTVTSLIIVVIHVVVLTHDITILQGHEPRNPGQSSPWQGARLQRIHDCLRGLSTWAL